MKIKVIRKKASSLRELSHEDIELEQISTLKDLLTQLTIHEYIKQNQGPKDFLTQEEINHQSLLGKISFHEVYNENYDDIQKSIHVMLQDYQDGLFRVYLNQEECTNIDEELCFQEENEVVIIRLIMMAGRLW